MSKFASPTSTSTSPATVVIAGATGGLGSQLHAKLEAARTWRGRPVQRVIVLDYFPAATRDAAIGAFTAKCKLPTLALHWDAGAIESTTAVLAAIDAATTAVDALLVTTGLGFHGDLKKLSVADSNRALQRMLNVNCVGPSLLAQHCAKKMPTTPDDAPVILLLSSYSGMIGLPDRAAYCCSKFALNGFAESLYADMPHLRVVLVCPTSVNTGFRDRWKKELGSIATHDVKSATDEKAALTVEECVAAVWGAFNQRWRHGVKYVVLKGWNADTASWAIRTWFLGDYARYRVLKAANKL